MDINGNSPATDCQIKAPRNALRHKIKTRARKRENGKLIIDGKVNCDIRITLSIVFTIAMLLGVKC